jgi:hypothetical protein
MRLCRPFLLSLILAILLPSCDRPQPPRAALAAAASGGAQPAPPIKQRNAQPYLRLQVSAAGQEKAKLDSVVATLDSLLASPELWKDFAVVVAQYPKIFVGPEYRQQGMAAGMADSAGATSFLQGSDSQTHTFEAILGLTGTYYQKGSDYVGTCSNPAGKSKSCRATELGQNYSNQFVATHGSGLILPSSRELVSIEIGREVFDRYNSASVTRRSCTYNTVAHEWTHTIGKDQQRHRALVLDTGAAVPGGVPKLSYLFGSVVQCSWLQARGGIGTLDSDLRACVAKFGAEKFNSLQCT